jgi:hypothetical protein
MDREGRKSPGIPAGNLFDDAGVDDVRVRKTR